jgi:uncharacterized protein (TIGR02145 family)
MDNEKGKSIISTRSSNLVKTEKLLSITQKILSEIKPQYESVRIGNQEWMTRNLDVDRFRNGDLVPHIESDEAWKEAGENSQPAWCYYDNDPENGKIYGKLYNWFAVNDSRGLAPEGYHVPTDEEWTSLVEFLGISNGGWKLKSVDDYWGFYKGFEGEDQPGNGDNSYGFTALPGGVRWYDGGNICIGYSAEFWSATEVDTCEAWQLSLFREYSDLDWRSSFKQEGLSVRCIKDSSDSRWAPAIRAGNIKPYVSPGLKLK